MTTTSLPTTIRASSTDDLLAVPAVLLGFQPEESCVVLGFEGKRVRFCARLDLAWLAEGLPQLAEQLLHAQDNFDHCEFVVLGYSENPHSAAESIMDLLAVLSSPVRDVLIASSDRYFVPGPDGLEPEEGLPWSVRDCTVSAQAVFHGVPVGRARDEAIAEVRAPSSAELAEAEYHITQAVDLLDGLDEQQQQRELARLIGCPIPLALEDAAVLAVLLADMEHVGEVMAQLSRASASRIRARLLEARRCADDHLAPNVVAVLGLACWLDGEGAQLSECLAQLGKLAPGHTVAELLQRIHSLAIPPSRWDE